MQHSWTSWHISFESIQAKPPHFHWSFDSLLLHCWIVFTLYHRHLTIVELTSFMSRWGVFLSPLMDCNNPSWRHVSFTLSGSRCIHPLLYMGCNVTVAAADIAELCCKCPIAGIQRSLPQLTFPAVVTSRHIPIAEHSLFRWISWLPLAGKRKLLFTKWVGSS